MLTQPTKFGPYLLLERISLGGMAEVFKAVEFGVDGFERTVAVKRILPHVAEDDEFITMFKDEARIAVQLQHGNIAQIYSLGHEADSFYIALEYVAGRDMRALFERCKKQRSAMPVAQACFIMMKVCEGLDYAHNKKDKFGQPLHIIHRDVSPPNILVSYEGEVKIVDFGVVKAAGRVSQTQAGILKGKFGYMSPEQVKGLSLDRRSDVFAVGVCLWELLTGKRLFHGETDFSTLEKVRAGEVQPPREINPDIAPELEKIVLRALTAEPNVRYQSASELHDGLQAFLFNQGLFYSRKDLAAWMRVNYAAEIEAEKERDRDRRADIERFKLSGRTDPPGVPRSTMPPVPRAPTMPAPPPSASGVLENVAADKRPEPPKPRGRAKTLLTTALASPGKATPPSSIPSFSPSHSSPGLPSPSLPPPGPTPSLPTPAVKVKGQGVEPAAPVKKTKTGKVAKVGGLEWDDDELETRLFDSPPGSEEAELAASFLHDPANLTSSRQDSVPPLTDLADSSAAQSLAQASLNAIRKPIPDPFASGDNDSDLDDEDDGVSTSSRTQSRGRRGSFTAVPTPAAGAGWSSRTLSRQVAPASPTLSAVASVPPSGRSPILWYGALGGAILAVALVVFAMSGKDDKAGSDGATTNPAQAKVDVTAQTGAKVVVEPSDARVTIDGTEYWGGAERVASRLPAGEHKLVVEASAVSGRAYLPHEQSFRVESGKFTPINVRLQPRSVKVNVTASDSKIRVSLITGSQISKLGRGSVETIIDRQPNVRYVIRAENESGGTVDVPLEFDHEAQKNVRVELSSGHNAPSGGAPSPSHQANPPTVAVNNPVSPLVAEPPAAEPTQDEPVVEEEEDEDVPERRTRPRSKPVVNKTGLLKIGTKLGLPPAEVFVDGKPSGTTPARVYVTPGSHRIRWQWKDGKTSTQSTEVDDGAVVSVMGD